MLAYSPPILSTTYGWPLLEDLIPNHLQQDNNTGISLQIEANSYHSSPFNLPTSYDQTLYHDFTPEETSISSGGFTGGTGDDKLVAKKLNHNASERDRRKKVNDLYSFLRSLLPTSSDQKVKVSIPGTVSRALKYIPELKKEVETLKCKKEKLWLCSSSITDTKRDHLGIKKQRGKEYSKDDSSAVSSVSVLGEKEVVIQLILSTDRMSMNKKNEIDLLSNVLEFLEKEEDGLVLINASTFKCFAEGMMLNTIHLQVQGDYKIDAVNLKEKLCTFYR